METKEINEIEKDKYDDEETKRDAIKRRIRNFIRKNWGKMLIIVSVLVIVFLFVQYGIMKQVTICINGVPVKTIRVFPGETVGKVPVPTDYQLVGWYYDSNLTEPVQNNVKINSPISLYMKWSLVGDGSSTKPYKIYNDSQFMRIADNPDKDFVLEKNITLNESEWDAINQFSGTLDGFNHTITFDNQPAPLTKLSGNGLFSTLTETGTIKNLTLQANVSLQISTVTYSGILVDVNYGTISNCHIVVDLSVNGQDGTSDVYIGALAGANLATGSITDSTTDGEINIVNNYDYYINTGGIVGNNEAKISDCENNAQISGSSGEGGIAGTNAGSIINATNSGELTDSAQSAAKMVIIGGIVSYNNGWISKSKNSGSMNAASAGNYSAAGGIAGENFGTISSSSNSAQISSKNTVKDSESADAGGIAGYGDGVIMQSNNSGTIYASSEENSANVGGIIGTSDGNIKNSYNTGEISGAIDSSDNTASAGGIVGFLLQDGTVQESYNSSTVTYDESTTGIYNSGGIAGYCEGSISSSYNTGYILAFSKESSGYAGGIVGFLDTNGTVTDAYNTGALKAETDSSDYISGSGGIAGDSYGTITNTYNTGKTNVGGTDDIAGGIVAFDDGTTITNCYWLDTNTAVTGLGRTDSTDNTIRCTDIKDMYSLATVFGSNWKNIPDSTPELNWQ